MNKKALYAFIISFALLTTVIVLNRRAFNDMRNFSKEVDHTREVITLFESLSNNFKSAQIYTKTYDRDTLKNFYRLYKAGADSVGGELVNLKLLVQDNPAQAAIVSDLTRMINNQMGILMEKNIAEVISSGEGGRLD